MIEVPNFKFVVDDGLGSEFIPTKANETDTGWDVRAAENYTIEPYETVKIKLGIRCFAPEGWWLELRPRSSTMAKKNLHCLYGVIDESYEGPIILAATLIIPVGMDAQTLHIEKGERVGQIIPIRRQSMKIDQVTNEEFDKLVASRNASRGAGGFGSSGVK